MSGLFKPIDITYCPSAMWSTNRACRTNKSLPHPAAFYIACKCHATWRHQVTHATLPHRGADKPADGTLRVQNPCDAGHQWNWCLVERLDAGVAGAMFMQQDEWLAKGGTRNPMDRRSNKRQGRGQILLLRTQGGNPQRHWTNQELKVNYRCQDNGWRSGTASWPQNRMRIVLTFSYDDETFASVTLRPCSTLEPLARNQLFSGKDNFEAVKVTAVVRETNDNDVIWHRAVVNVFECKMATVTWLGDEPTISGRHAAYICLLPYCTFGTNNSWRLAA